MYGDFSRMTFSRRRQYSSVWAQQGRVQLDADINEQAAILLDYMRTLALDFIGPFGGPVERAGFRIDLEPGSDLDRKSADLRIGPGHYYVYGMRCEAARNGAGWPGQPLSWRHQPRGPQERGEIPEPPFIAYLRVWEESVSAVQDPSLLEPALGLNPPDTTARSQVAWELVASDMLPGRRRKATDRSRAPAGAHRPVRRARRQPGAAGLLRARATTPADAEDHPSAIAAPSRYRGASSQLYRVEIHTGGPAGTATFKWSRENGAVVFAIESLAGNQAVVTSLGRDARTGLEISDWVEIVDDRWVPDGDPGPLLQVADIDHVSRQVTLEGGPIPAEYLDSPLHPFLRRWDQHPAGRSRAPDNAELVPESTDDHAAWLSLEEGVHVEFPAGDGPHHYRRGDYWQIPARAATGDVIWPSQTVTPPRSPR